MEGESDFLRLDFFQFFMLRGGNKLQFLFFFPTMFSPYLCRCYNKEKLKQTMPVPWLFILFSFNKHTKAKEISTGVGGYF
jgi:hypothetical protein